MNNEFVSKRTLTSYENSSKIEYLTKYKNLKFKSMLMNYHKYGKYISEINIFEGKKCIYHLESFMKKDKTFPYFDCFIRCEGDRHILIRKKENENVVSIMIYDKNKLTEEKSISYNDDVYLYMVKCSELCDEIILDMPCFYKTVIEGLGKLKCLKDI